MIAVPVYFIDDSGNNVKRYDIFLSHAILVPWNIVQQIRMVRYCLGIPRFRLCSEQKYPPGRGMRRADKKRDGAAGRAGA
jgi:hypothetical protein